MMDMEESNVNDIYADLTAYGGDVGGCSGVTGVKVYDGSNSYVTVRLSDIPMAEITEVEDPETGEPRRGLFLPFRNSGLTVTPKRNVLLVCKSELAQVPSARYTHLLTQVMDRSTGMELRRMGYKTGYIGHSRPMGSGNKKRRKI